MADEDTKKVDDDTELDDDEGEDKSKKSTKVDDQKLTKSEWQEIFEKDVLPKRLSRKEKEVFKTLGINGPDDYATINSKAQKYDSEIASKQSDDEKRATREAERDKQFADLQRDLKARDYKILVGEVADDMEVPKKLRKFLKGEDEDSLRESAQDLLDAMSEVGGNKEDDTKKKNTKDTVTETKVVHGGGGAKKDQTVDPKALAEKILKRNSNLVAR